MTDEREDLEEQLAEARAQIESLQAAAADAEARAATAGADAKTAREQHDELTARLTEAETAREAAAGELTELRSGVQALEGQLREATVRYREARLAGAPDIPADLVPELATIEEIDREFEAAQRVVGQLREKIEKEAVEQHRSARVPAGAPSRRSQDVSALSPSEKIRLGLQQRS